MDARATTAPDGGDDQHLSCATMGQLVRRVRSLGGSVAVEELLRGAGSRRSAEYLEEQGNWVSYDEAIALFDAAAELTGDPEIARTIGENAVRQHAGTPVATLLRSLGSPEEVLRQVTLAVSKFATVTQMEALEVGPGRAVVRAQAAPGFVRHRHLCHQAVGLLTQPTVLFGLPPATVEESECQARGGRHCLYTVSWDESLAAAAADPREQVTSLEAQLAAMSDRLDNVFATARDLIAHDDLDATLARITERAATAVRAPRYLLALEPVEGARRLFHQRGLTEAEAAELAPRALSLPRDELPASWLVAEVQSGARRYGRLLALYDGEGRFFPQEEALLRVYARYAAAALDGATVLADARRRHEEASALLDLARSLAAAGTSEEIARRLAEAVGTFVDCDTVQVFVWDEADEVLSCKAVTGRSEADSEALRAQRFRPEDTPEIGDLAAGRLRDPFFLEVESEGPFLHQLMRRFGSQASVVVPIVARERFLGALTVGVSSRPERLQLSPALLDRLGGVTAQAASALENGRLVDAITRQALHDDLTALPNRRLLKGSLERALAAGARAGRPSALVFIDLDRFKHVNDTLGHALGDQLLVKVAERLGRQLRAGDTLARLGGDEFVILVEGEQAGEEGAAVAGRVLSELQKPFTIAGRELFVSASIGVVVTDPREARADDVLRHADAAMYEAKARGRGRFHVFEQHGDGAGEDRLELETDLRRAIERDQLVLHYQPTYRLADGRLNGFEALLRWQHPSHGLLEPDAFISLAEETGLIVPIGRWALGEATAQVGAWGRELGADPGLAMNVNVSALQLHEEGFLDELAEVLGQSGIAPGSLWLEITESTYVDAGTADSDLVGRIRGLGARIALDDFGSGYSNLASLKRFPVDGLKLDRSLVVELAADRVDAAIARTIVDLARALGVTVTAEGIERPEQLGALRELGCQFGQGFLLGRAVPAPLAGQMLAETLGPDRRAA